MQWLHEGFAVSLDATTVSCELKKLGYAKLTARPATMSRTSWSPEALKQGLCRRGSMPVLINAGWHRLCRAAVTPHAPSRDPVVEVACRPCSTRDRPDHGRCMIGEPCAGGSRSKGGDASCFERRLHEQFIFRYAVDILGAIR